jgi:hypothetical protein
MRLSKISLAGFRSFRNPEEIKFDPHLTILAGRNNVGKTASLLGLRLPMEVRPGVREDFQLEYTWAVTRDDLIRSIQFAAEPGLFSTVSSQIETKENHELRVLLKLPTDAGRLPDVEGSGGTNGAIGSFQVHEVEVVATSLKAIYGRIRGFSPPSPTMWWAPGTGIGGGNARVVELMQVVGRALQQFFYLQPRRIGSETMRFEPTLDVAPDGSNLTNVIGTIYNNDRLGSFKALEDFTRAAFRDVNRIDVLMTPGPQATINLVFGGPNGLVVPLEYCGTGIEQMLVLGSAVLTSTTDRVFLLDEPHAFLHPDAERSLIRFLDEHSRHQYIVATHSGVFLNAYPLSHARLVTLTEQGTRVADVAEASEILTEVGITAADLWSNDAILWVEGPSEQAIVERLLRAEPGMRDVSVRVTPMPDSVRAAARSLKTAQGVVGFCAAVLAAVTPVKVQSVFLFDADEKTEELKQRIMDATDRRARFLGVRELENLFLNAPALQEAISARCAEVGRPSPTSEELQQELNDLVAQSKDSELYRREPEERPDAERVVGSAVLRRLYWKWVQAEYDKVADGRRLVESVIRLGPDRLEPIMRVLRDMAAEILSERSR